MPPSGVATAIAAAKHAVEPAPLARTVLATPVTPDRSMSAPRGKARNADVAAASMPSLRNSPTAAQPVLAATMSRRARMAGSGA